MADIHLLVAAATYRIIPVLLLVSCLGGASLASRCPARCTCYSGSLDVDCNYCGLRDIPLSSSIPDHTQKFRLKSNSIRQIPSRAFESLTELRHLDLSANAIAFLDNQTFFGLPKLESLSLSRNHIESLEGNPFQALSNLKTLLLKENQIKVIGAQAFAGLFHLMTLDLSNNSIQGFPQGVFSNLKALSEIHLTVNYISQIASGVFDGLRQLPTLNLSFNHITDFEKDAFKGVGLSVQRLYLDYNKIATVPPGVFCGFPLLEEISFFGNTLQLISTDSFMDLPSLRFLNLSRNQISMLEPKTFQSLQELVFLDISNNRLQTIKSFLFMGLRQMVELNLEYNRIQVLDQFSFFGCSSLSVLRLGNNQIHTIHPGAFEGAYFLTNLQLENNNLTFWPSEATKAFKLLHTITLFNNFVGELQEGVFRGLVNMHACNLSHNNITRIMEGAFSDLGSLRSLDLSRNSLSGLGSNTFPLPKLKVLNISRNFIHRIRCDAFSGLGALELLNLNDNQLSEVPSCALENVPSLITLDLSGNAIHHLEKGAFTRLGFLQELYMQTNGLASVHPLAFLQLGRLQVVNLQNNSLASFNAQWFSNCPVLQYLSLSNNDIQAINNVFFSEARMLKEFSAQGNPWCCNCSNFWLTENRSIMDSGSHHLYICHSPAEWESVNAFEAIGRLPCRAPKIWQIQEASECAAGAEGESSCLSCRATGFPEPEVDWILPDQTKGTTVFDPVSKSHALELKPGRPVLGNYTCRAKNVVGVDERQVFVNVNKMLSVAIPHRYIAAEDNSTVNLTCLVRGYLDLSEKWTVPLGLQYPGHYLSLESVSHRDVGTYHCVDNNSQASINGTAYMAFVSPQEIQDRLVNFSSLAAERVAFPCFASRFPPPNGFQKLPNLHRSGTSTKEARLQILEQGEFLIDNLAWSDSGVYVCEAAGMGSLHHVVLVFDHASFVQAPNLNKHLKLLLVVLLVFPVFIGIASLCSRIPKKHRVKVIQVQPLPEINYKGGPNDTETVL